MDPQDKDKSKLLYELKERLKELECLYAIEKVIAFSDEPFEKIMSEVVRLIPGAMQYPEDVCIRITLKDNEFKTPNFKETKLKETRDILVNKSRAGSIELSYLGHISDSGGFLDEEKWFINNLAVRLGRFYERKLMEEKLKESNAELELRVKIRTAELTRLNEDLQKEVREKKFLEAGGKEREHFLSSVFASIQDGISILDKDMKILRVNSTIERWYAHAMPLVGKKCFKAYHSSDRPCEVCPTRRTLETGEATHEIIPKRGFGKSIVGWLDLFSFPLIDENTGEMTGVIEYVRDISEQKKAQDERDKLTKEFLESNKKLKALSLSDALTGLYNYRYLEEVIEAEFYRAKRYVHPLSFLMFDIDYFKSINDLYGHQFGDLVLKQLAKLLRSLIRKYDIAIRLGGEEFVVVSPGVDRSGALVLANRLLETINLFNFGDKEHSVKLKLSIAAVSYPEDKIKDGLDLVNLADKVLNKVKEYGGNRVYSCEDLKKSVRGSVVGGKSKIAFLLKSKLDKLTKKSNQSLVEAISGFAKTIELKDHTTGEHVERTVHYVTEIAKSMNLGQDETELLRQASMLHDLGKIGISEKILLKKGKLTKKEFDEIKKHPQIAADILRPIHFLRELIPLVYYHHERWDGKGYPIGLKGEEIPVSARIIAIADVYEALTTARPYRKRPYTKKEAIRIIKSYSGSRFDPRIVPIFIKILQEAK